MSFIKITLLIVEMIITGSFLLGKDIQLVGKIPISQKDRIIQVVDGIAVLSEGSFIMALRESEWVISG